jgi:hypothetical protein
VERETYRGTNEIPWCTKKGMVVYAVVSCPPCCPPVELQREKNVDGKKAGKESEKKTKAE